ANYRNHFLGSMWITFKRVLRLCFVPVDTGDRAFLRVAFLVVLLGLYALAVPAGIAGLNSTDRTSAVAGVVLVMIAVDIVASSVFLTNSRFFEPFRPAFMVLASGTLAAMLPRRS